MRISDGTQERVRQAARELGYRPNRSARNLRTAKTATIGVISDFVASGHFASHMLTGAGAAARAVDHLLLIGETEGDPEQRSRVIEEMLDREVDGILYATVTTSQVSVPDMLLNHRVALLNCVDPDARLPAVLPDERGGGRAAAGLLLARGVEGEVLVVGEDPTVGALAGALRLEGIRAAFREAGRAVPGVIPCAWDVVPAYDAVDAWLTAGNRPGALICLNDRVAMGVYQALDAHGLDVPGDVSVVAFDGSELASWLRPVVSTVMVPYAAMGELAVRLLMDPGLGSSNGTSNGSFNGVIELAMPLVEGRSVRCPPEGSAIDDRAG
jgi:LacI family transcriptional regulator